MSEGMRSRQIPHFATREEEAEFWDTHDLSDYWDQFTPVEVEFAEHLSNGITIPLDQSALARLRAQARDRRMTPTALAQMWVLERLHDASSC